MNFEELAEKLSETQNDYLDQIYGERDFELSSEDDFYIPEEAEL